MGSSLEFIVKNVWAVLLFILGGVWGLAALAVGIVAALVGILAFACFAVAVMFFQAMDGVRINRSEKSDFYTKELRTF